MVDQISTEDMCHNKQVLSEGDENACQYVIICISVYKIYIYIYIYVYIFLDKNETKKAIKKKKKHAS